MAKLCTHLAIERALVETLRLRSCEWHCTSGCGPAGGKADDQGKFWTFAHDPDTVPGASAEWIGQDTSGVERDPTPINGLRHVPKVGTVCGSSARTDLCGGRAVRPVPTAILFRVVWRAVCWP